MSELITIAVFTFPQEIVVLKSILEHENIVHFFENETLVSVDPFASIAYGGIKLKIYPEDETRVKKIIENLDSNLKVV